MHALVAKKSRTLIHYPTPGAEISPEPEARAQVLAEGIGRLNDAGFNQHLTDRNIQLADQAPDFLQANRNVLHEKLVGARIHHRTAAF